MEIHELSNAPACVSLRLPFLRYRKRHRCSNEARIPGRVLHVSGSRHLLRAQGLRFPIQIAGTDVRQTIEVESLDMGHRLRCPQSGDIGHSRARTEGEKHVRAAPAERNFNRCRSDEPVLTRDQFHAARHMTFDDGRALSGLCQLPSGGFPTLAGSDDYVLYNLNRRRLETSLLTNPHAWGDHILMLLRITDDVCKDLHV